MRFKTTSALSWMILALLSALLHKTFRNPSFWVIPYTIGWGVLALRFFQQRTESSGSNVTLSSLIVFFLLLLLGSPGVLYWSSVAEKAHFIHLTGITGIVFLLSLKWRRLWPLLGVLVFVIQLHVLKGSPSPFMDVFTIGTEAAQALLRGINPYTQVFTDIYPGGSPYKAFYCYWPAHLFEITGAYALFHDVRAASILAFWITACSCYWLSRRAGLSAHQARLRALFFLLLPMSFLQLEQAWVDVPLLAALAAAAIFFENKQSLWTGVLAATALATKQYAIVPIAFLSVEFWLLRKTSPKMMRSYALGLVLGVLGYFGPFLVTAPRHFFESSIQHFFNMPPRWDGFNWPSLLHQHLALTSHWMVEGVLKLSPVMTLLMAGACLYSMSKKNMTWLEGSALTFGVLFLTSKMSFINYHYLAISLAVLALIRRESLLKIRSQTSPHATAL